MRLASLGAAVRRYERLLLVLARNQALPNSMVGVNILQLLSA